MSPAETLLKDLARAGLTVHTDGDRLLVRPAHLLTDEYRARIALHRPALLQAVGRCPLTDAQLDAIAARASDDPPDFGSGHVVDRPSALVCVFGRWVAADPDFLAWAAAHNRAAHERWLKRFPAEKNREEHHETR